MDREQQIWAALSGVAGLATIDAFRRGEDALWPVLLIAVTALELEAIRQGDLDRTITRTTRRWFRTQHPAGKAAFVVTWAGFSIWYARHILSAPRAVPSG